MMFAKSKPIMSLLWNKLEAIFIDVGRVIWIYLIFLFSESYKLSFYCINIDSYKNKLSFLGWYLLQFMSSLSYSLPTLLTWWLVSMASTMNGLYGFHDLIRSKWYSSLYDFWVELMGVWCLWGNFLCLGDIINFYIL